MEIFKTLTGILIVAAIFAVGCKKDQPLSNDEKLVLFDKSIIFTPHSDIVDNRYQVTFTIEKEYYKWDLLNSAQTMDVRITGIEAYNENKPFSGNFDNNAFTINEYISLSTIAFKVKYEIFYTTGSDSKVIAQKETLVDSNLQPIQFSISDITNMIRFDFPLDRQCNFMKGDFPHGFIFFNCIPSFLENTNIKFSVVITDITSAKSWNIDMVYDKELKVLKYEMPELDNEKIYKVEYLSSGKEQFYRINYFSTSKYNKFEEKFNIFLNSNLPQLQYGVHPTLISYLALSYATTNPVEFFDDYELSAIPYETKEVPTNLVTNLVDKNAKKDKDEMYSFAKKYNLSMNHRNADYFGFNPYRNLFYLRTNKLKGSLLTDKEIAEKTKEKLYFNQFMLLSLYDVLHWYDYVTLRDQAVPMVIGKQNPEIPISEFNKFMDENGDTDYSKSLTKITFQYIIPGIDKVIFEKEIKLPDNAWKE